MGIVKCLFGFHKPVFNLEDGELKGGFCLDCGKKFDRFSMSQFEALSPGCEVGGVVEEVKRPGEIVISKEKDGEWLHHADMLSSKRCKAEAEELKRLRPVRPPVDDDKPAPTPNPEHLANVERRAPSEIIKTRLRVLEQEKAETEGQIQAYRRSLVVIDRWKEDMKNEAKAYDAAVNRSMSPGAYVMVAADKDNKQFTMRDA